MNDYPDLDRVWFKCPVCNSVSCYIVYESYQDGYDFTIDEAPIENIQEIVDGSIAGEFQCFACRTFLWLLVEGESRKIVKYNSIDKKLLISS